MTRRSTINKKDSVRLRKNLTSQQYTKLHRFIKKQWGDHTLRAFTSLTEGSFIMKVIAFDITPQTNTKIALMHVYIKGPDGDINKNYPYMMISFQLRYLKLVEKHCAHPLTKIFL